MEKKHLSFFFFSHAATILFPRRIYCGILYIYIYNMASVSLGKDLSDRQQHSVGFGRILQTDMTAKE